VPDKYECGNHNVPGIAGLAAGVRFLREQGVASIAAHQRVLTHRLLSGFAGIAGVNVHGPRDAERQVGVVSITLAQSVAQEVASVLDTAYSIQVRPGLHCAPLMHRALGTMDHGGTVRFSLGAMSTEEQVDAAIQAVTQIAATLSA
jgi:selenocysteine lyase/cysteine desulfurase